MAIEKLEEARRVAQHNFDHAVKVRDEYKSDYDSAEQAVQSYLTAAQLATNELGKAKLTAAIDLIRKVYREAPFGSAAHGDIAALFREMSTPSGVTTETALSGGGKAPGMNTPGSGAGSAQPVTKVPKLGGVHGVGEGWYKPLIYDAQGVKLEHDFAINTRDHHEARNGWWLKHVPSGQITKGFPNEAETYRWIRGRNEPRLNGYLPFDPRHAFAVWAPGRFINTK